MPSRVATLLLLTLPLALAPLSGGPLRAQTAPADPQRELLERMTGHWVLRGTISSGQTTHDVDARWVLERGYVEIHEVSRERDAAGKPQYEALVYVVWDPKLGEYGCLWLDTTGVAAFPPAGVGHAKPEPDRIPFVFGDADDGIHNTFSYDRAKDQWSWAIDNAIKGALTPFARLTLARQ